MKKFKTESQKILNLMINSIYTNKEIFLRELLSNCSDAIDKLYYKSLQDNISGLSRNDFYISIIPDKANRTLKIIDNGIGMTAEELESNLGTIARSGSLDFKTNEDIKDEDINIIGQFGVGFYSAFMVAKKVEVLSKAYGHDEANIWISSGADGYEVKSADKYSNGTEITLYLKDDTDGENYSTYLEEYTIKNLVKKYSDYVRYPIKTEITKYKDGEGEDGKEESYKELETLNSMTPIWKKNKNEVTKEEYDTFYKDTFFDQDPPIKTIQMSVEGTVDFKAILFIPEKAPYNYYSKQYEKGLKLYTNGVMIMEKCADLLPDYFSFVKGIVDSELVLNISRETVQQSRQLKAIANSIEKKIKSELLSMQADDREAYEKFYKAFGLQLKYGIYTGWGMNKEMLQDLIMFHSIKEDKLVTLKEYVEKMSEGQESIYYVTGKSIEGIKALPQTEKLLDQGKDILCMTDEVDEFAIKFLNEYDKKTFKNATQEDAAGDDEATTEEDKEIIGKVKEVLGDKVSKVVGTNSLKSHPVCLSSEGEISIEMERVLASMPNNDGSVKAQRVLEINLSHKILAKLKAVKDDDEKFSKICNILYSEACLIAGLPIENTTELADSIIDLIAE